MVKDHSAKEQQGIFYKYHPTAMIVHTMAFVIPVVEQWQEQDMAQWVIKVKGRKEASYLMTLNTFYLRLYGIRHMVKDHSEREETLCHHMVYSFQLAARILLYASAHRQDNTYNGLCYTSRGALARQ